MAARSSNDASVDLVPEAVLYGPHVGVVAEEDAAVWPRRRNPAESSSGTAAGAAAAAHEGVAAAAQGAVDDLVVVVVAQAARRRQHGGVAVLPRGSSGGGTGSGGRGKERVEPIGHVLVHVHGPAGDARAGTRGASRDTRCSDRHRLLGMFQCRRGLLLDGSSLWHQVLLQ